MSTMNETVKLKTEPKEEASDLNAVLQCPVCYEVPIGHIFQCNEGHHVCSECKSKLRNCPVCRSYYFGTRNYAMEDLLANIRKIEAFKLTGVANVKLPLLKENGAETSGKMLMEKLELPKLFVNSSGGLWLCFFSNCHQRLPSCRLLNHLRQIHRQSLVEARFENYEYYQVWDVSKSIPSLTNAISVQGVGVFWLNFKIVEGNTRKVYAWLTMAAVSEDSSKFSYTLRVTGTHMELTFCDHVHTSKQSEGSLIKCLNSMVLTDEETTPSDTIRFQLHLWYDHERIDSSGNVAISSAHTTVRLVVEPRDEIDEDYWGPDINSELIYAPVSSRRSGSRPNSTRTFSNHYMYGFHNNLDIETLYEVQANSEQDDVHRTSNNRNRTPSRNNQPDPSSRMYTIAADVHHIANNGSSPHQPNLEETAPATPRQSRYRNKRARRRRNL